MLRQGRNVPLATIAAQAGVGIPGPAVRRDDIETAFALSSRPECPPEPA